MKFSRTSNLISVNFRLCLKEIQSNKLRSIITSFGIFLGVTSYLVNVAFIRGIDNDIKMNLDKIGGLKIITIKTKEPLSVREAITFSKSAGLNFKEIKEISDSLPYTVAVLPKEELDWNIANANGKTSYVKPIAISNDFFKVYNYDVQTGRLLTLKDDVEKRNNCLIGIMVAQNCFPNKESAIGQSITVLGQPFTIVGIIKTDDPYSWKAVQFLIPYSFYTYRLSAERNIKEIAVQLKNSTFVNRARFDFYNLLKQKHRGVEDFQIESNQSKIDEMRTASLGINVLLWSISAITLLIGGISIMNIMFATLGDRIREIGVRKALGAKKTDIFTQFIIEAIVISFVGGLPGLIIGPSVILLPKGIFPYTPSLSIADFGMAITFTLAAGIISGLSPAIRAATMLPIEALRN